MKELSRFILGLMALIIFVFIMSPKSEADHNTNPRYPDTMIDRGYNKDNCDNMTSKVTGKQAEWLGHVVGCLVEDKNGYVLIEEFKVQFLTWEAGKELRELAKKYTLPDPKSKALDV
jgi:hypothetical protein